MKNKFILPLVLFFVCFAVAARAEAPLRIFIRAGVKTHGPGQHDHPRFLKEWTELLNQRGAQAEGGMDFPTPEQLARTDVLIFFAGDAGDITPEQRVYFNEFLKRGGGVVFIHDAIGSHDPDWLKTVIGGAWRYGKAKYFEGPISFYYVDHNNPITRDASNFDVDDEQYYDLELLPEAHVLAVTYQPDERNQQGGRAMPSVYDTAPQMWTYEKDNYRAFVSIPGHNYTTFDLPQYRAVLLRGIAWAGKREVDSLVSREELASLVYPPGGPTAPEEAAKKLVVEPGFNIRLVASEPLIEKPISMDWDPRGRLWIAETPEYPFRKDRSRAPYDRISILEDTHHDGLMDKKTVFYDGLDLVTSMVFYRDGVIVSQAPYIIRLSDTKGTGKADKREILYKGFGTNDTHAVVNNLRWGMDGWIYATLGYTRGDIYSGDDRTHFGRLSEGVIRFKADGSAIEQVSSKGGNTWGVDLGPDREIFFSQANGSHINHVVVPESVLARGRVGNATSFLNIEDHNRSYPLMSWKNQAYVQIDWVGNFTAAAGCCIYDGGAWPEKYNYTEYVSEPTINIVHQDFLRPKGVSYVASKDPARLEQEFIASKDLWFRPIHQRVGPDGALYILDFYNQAVVHNDTRGPRHDPQDNAAIRPDRNHHFGRIWRVQNDNAKIIEVPDLENASQMTLVKALEHPNEWVRMTALRLLLERGKTDVVPQLEELAASAEASDYARIHALWLLSDLKQLDRKTAGEVLVAAIGSSDPAIAKNALDMAETSGSDKSDKDLREAVAGRLSATNARVRLQAIIAMQRMGTPDASAVHALMDIYPQLDDEWSKSAWIGVASESPVPFIAEAFKMLPSKENAELVGRLSAGIGEKQDANAAAKLVIMISGAPAASDPLKEAALAGLTSELKLETVPDWSAELQTALQTLLGAETPAAVYSNQALHDRVAMLALPFAARWDKNGTLAGPIKAKIAELEKSNVNGSQSEESRLQIAKSLLAVRKLDANILPTVMQMVTTASPELQLKLISALGELSDTWVAQALIGIYPQLAPASQNAVFNQLLKRKESSLALISAIEANKIKLTTLGPVAISRLRTHSNTEVAERANEVIDRLRGPETKEKDALIAKFTPLVTQPGDVAHGQLLFSQICAVCHSFNGVGHDVAPDLTGMGAHGPAELIIHVLDPNREVEPNYYAQSIETKDGEIYDGVIARENQSTVTMKNAAGTIEIKVANIKSRRNTGKSLMPEGFESLGPEVLRDILAYLCAGEANFRILNLEPVFTANSDHGLWLDEQNDRETWTLRKFGVVKEGGVPFGIVNPLKSLTGKNVIVLKGGSGFAKSMPQRVEIADIGVKAAKLDILGAAGWGYPWSGEASKGLPVAKMTVHYQDRSSEEIILKNGVDFEDWVGGPDLPGLTSAPDLVVRGQIKWVSKTLQHPGVIQSITIESMNNSVSPTIVAITAELNASGATSAEPAPASTEKPSASNFNWEPGKTHVLIVGGGSSHDFNKWFNEVDSATLRANGDSVNYTDKLDEVAAALKDVDVLYWCSNQAMEDESLHKAIFDFADAGHGLVLVHPALWYNWNNWPEYNRTLVGGGAHGHDKYGEFEVDVKNADHPVMKGVPMSFKLSDELYHMEVDPKATPIETLAESINLTTGTTFPCVWIVKHPHTRIVCITLGHDASAHELAAYQTILKNAVNWAAGANATSQTK